MGELIKTIFLFIVLVAVLFVGVLFIKANPQFIPAVPGFEGTATSKLPRIDIITDAFLNDSVIPDQYTCKGVNISPYLKFENVPVNTKSLNIIFVDPDAPGAPFYHWVVINIDPNIREIPENSIPKDGEIMINDFGSTTYSGPCPSSGEHKYYLYVYANGTKIDKTQFESTAKLLEYLNKNALAMGALYGKFKLK